MLHYCEHHIKHIQREDQEVLPTVDAVFRLDGLETCRLECGTHSIGSGALDPS